MSREDVDLREEPVAVSAGQKVAGVIMRVFGLLLVIAACLYLVAFLVAITIPQESFRGVWVPLLIGLSIGVVLMLVGSLMSVAGLILGGVVRIVGRRSLFMWCLMSCCRDPLFILSALLSVFGLFLLTSNQIGIAFSFYILVGLWVWIGVNLGKEMKKIVREPENDAEVPGGPW